MPSSDKCAAQRRLGIVTDAAALVLSAVRNSGDAFPPLKSTAAIILILVETVQLFSSNKKDWEALTTLIVDRVAAIAEVTGTEPPPDLAINIQKLNSTLSDIVAEVKSLARRSAIVRSLQVQTDRKKIAGYQEKMKEALDSFNLVGLVAIWRATSTGTPGSRAIFESESLVFDLNLVTPTPPVHLYGRDHYLQSIVDIVTDRVGSGRSAHIVIRGPGGIGKTSVALALFHDVNVGDLFKTKRYFVRCEAAETPAILLSTIASVLGIRLSNGNALKLVLQGLNSSKNPLLLFLDNAETFWLCHLQSQVRLVLQQVAALPHVTLVLTMRGTELPNVTVWDQLQPLGTLTLDAARESFLAIATEQQPSCELDILLRNVDCVPLAVTLLARISQISDSPAILCERWDVEQTDLLRMASTDRDNNIGISIKLSLESLPMKDDPLAFRLLSIVCYLPGGISEVTIGEMTGLPLSGLRAASHTLKRLSLVHEYANSWITTLSPIRAYIRVHHPPRLDDVTAMLKWHLALAKSGSCNPGDSEYQNAVNELTANNSNISFTLQVLIGQGRVSENVIWAVIHYSKFLYFTMPNSDLLEILLTSESSMTTDMKAKVLQSLGDMKRMQCYHAEAQAILEEARRVFLSLGDQLSAAHCLQSLGLSLQRVYLPSSPPTWPYQSCPASVAFGDQRAAAQCLRSVGFLMGMQDYTIKGALNKLEESRKILLETGNQLGAAQCLLVLGEIMLRRDDYLGAQQAVKAANLEFAATGSRIGTAQSLRSLGYIFLMQGDYGGSWQTLKTAETEFLAEGDGLGATQCLQCFGYLMIMQEDYERAHETMWKARRQFESFGNLHGATHCLLSLGNIMWRQGAYEKAHQIFEEATAEFSALGTKEGIALCSQSLGDTLRMQRDYSAARVALEDARTELLALGQRRIPAQCLRSLGNISWMEGDRHGALQALEEAGSVFSELGCPQEELKCTIMIEAL